MSTPAHPFRVMIVEDDRRINPIVESVVSQRAAFEVMGVAESLAEARTLLLGEVPDLLLVDMSLPDGDGLELVRYCRQQGMACDVIVITASRSTEVIQAAMQEGVFDYIVKPLRLARIAQSLEHFVEVKATLQRQAELDQHSIDSLLGRPAVPAPQRGTPKGIDEVTLRAVTELLRAAPDEGFTIERIATELTIGRTTARRYLEYLEAEQLLSLELNYGTRGRPERVFRWCGTAA
ncbi:response regulator [Pokkaliibacter plantistimulans]|nr:response regulator [Pokkaliibacter plantistimulans]